MYELSQYSVSSGSILPISSPRIRVVIPARFGMSTMPSCLSAIRKSKDVFLEIVIVNDGGNPGLEALAREHGALVRHTSGGEGAGPARNLGAVGFETGILVFVDADVAVDPRALARLIEPLRTHGAHASVGSYSDSTEGMNFAEAYKELYLAHTYGSNPGWLRNQFWTALGAIRADVFTESGGFHQAYRGSGSEDVELGVRLTNANKRVFAVPEATGRHMAKRTVVSTIQNDLHKGCGDFYTHLKHRAELTSNRHATKGAVGAVGVSGLALLSIVAALVFHPV
jgi:GT2 family glycosyltransferase